MPAAAEPEAPAAPHFDASRARAGVVVMKFGEGAIVDVDGIRGVALRLAAAHEAGHGVVGVLAAMASTTSELVALARQVSPNPSERELDMLVSVGERASCALAAMALVDLGYNAVSLTGSQAGIVTDTAHGSARIVEVRARRVREALDRGAIVLVAGLQGVSTDSEVTTLGRGGSEATAVALAAALAAEACEILGTAGGVYSADARLIPGARKLTALSHDELLEIASSGGAPVPLRSVELARNHAVLLQVRSSSTDDEGTWVVTEEDGRLLERAIISAVTHTVDETVYRVEGGVPAAGLFTALADADVNVDTILQTGDGLVFSASTQDGDSTQSVLDRLGASWSADPDLGQVSVVGAGMKSHPGVAATAFATLEEHGIEPVIVTTSPIRISCHVRRDAVETAVRALHHAFGLDANGEQPRG
jgi:aspartate kinase